MGGWSVSGAREMSWGRDISWEGGRTDELTRGPAAV
jgi:hypothetical protein